MSRAVTAIATLIAAGLLAGLADAPCAQAQTIDEAMISAYANNPKLLARRARVRGADEQIPQASAGWRPTISLKGDVGRGRYESNSGTPPRQIRTPKNESLELTQNLYKGGKTTANTRKAEANALSERYSLESVEQSVLLAVATAYMDVLRDQAVLALNANNEQVLRRQLEATQDRFRVGDVTRTDVAQSEARLAKATADRIASEGQLQTSRAAFVNAVGDAPGELKAPGLPGDLPATLADAAKSATAENPDVRAAEYLEKAAQENIDVNFADLLPSVNLTTELSRAFRTSSANSRSETVEIVAAVTVPIYQGGEEYAKVREAKHVAGQRKREIDQARRDARESVTKAWENLESARARVTSYLSQIRASEIALDGVRNEAAVGARTVLDVLDAEQELLDARVNTVKAERDVLVSAYQLRSAMGRLSARALGLPVEVYDAESHFQNAKSRWWGLEIEPESTK